jgi:hypothetical protein
MGVEMVKQVTTENFVVNGRGGFVKGTRKMKCAQ